MFKYLSNLDSKDRFLNSKGYKQLCSAGYTQVYRVYPLIFQSASSIPTSKSPLILSVANQFVLCFHFFRISRQNEWIIVLEVICFGDAAVFLQKYINIGKYLGGASKDFNGSLKLLFYAIVIWIAAVEGDIYRCRLRRDIRHHCIK